MDRFKTLLYPAMLFVTSSFGGFAQQNPPPPTGAFRTLHIMTIPAGQEKAYMAATQEMNAVVSKQGCSSCVYHLYKIETSGNGGQRNYVQMSSWPSGEVYTRIHKSPEFQQIVNRHNSVVDAVFKTEDYYRMTEVKLAQ